MASAKLFASVLHLPTGHVLAAVTSGDLEPTVEELADEDGVRVRIPDDAGFVNVPASALTALRVVATDDLLDRAQHYRVGAATPPLTLGDPPEFGTTTFTGAPGDKAVVVWQDGTESVVASGVLDATGAPPGNAPPGATHQLLAIEGAPLFVKPL